MDVVALALVPCSSLWCFASSKTQPQKATSFQLPCWASLPLRWFHVGLFDVLRRAKHSFKKPFFQLSRWDSLHLLWFDVRLFDALRLAKHSFKRPLFFQLPWWASLHLLRFRVRLFYALRLAKHSLKRPLLFSFPSGPRCSCFGSVFVSLLLCV